MILLSGLPIGDMVAWAEGEIEPIFESIVVNKIFRDLYGAERYSILITGDNFIIDNINQVEVGIMGEDGIVKAFNPTYTSKTMVQYELEPDQISGDLYINGEKIDISEGDIPYITNKTPTTGMVDSAGDGKITLEGSGFQNLSNTIKAYLFQGTTAYKISNTEENNTKLTSEILKGKLEFGLLDLIKRMRLQT